MTASPSPTPRTGPAVHPFGPRWAPPVPDPPARDPSLPAFLRAAGRNGIGLWPARAYHEPVVTRRLLGRERITLCAPDAVRRVLVDNVENYARTPITVRMLRPVLGDGLLISEGAAWRHQRRTLAPAFAPRAVEALIPHILAATDTALDALDAEAADGPVDLFAALQHLALEIAGRTMFSLGMARHGQDLRALVERYGERLARPRLSDFLLPLGWGPRDRARARFRRTWTTFLDRVIAERDRAAGGPSRDLLDRLGAARDPETDRPFTPEALRDQVATLILAGHETTALTLLWACTLLAQDERVQDALHAEARADAGTEGDPSQRLPLTRAVIDETLRLYPPAFMTARLARAPDTLAGHAVPAGAVVIVAPWLLHRHRRLWAEPDTFDPGRFLPGAPPVERYAYLPFGAGPRVCIGAQFALAEAVLALSRLVGRFRIALAGSRPVLPAPVVTTQPDHAPPFRLTRRG